jgi:hypothetical protein
MKRRKDTKRGARDDQVSWRREGLMKRRGI